MGPGRWAVLLAVLSAGEARAYRPFDETDADVAELHVLELEFGPLQLQRSAGFTAYVPTLILNLGVLPGWELVVDALGSVPVGSPRAPGATGQLETGLALKGVVRRGTLQGGEGPSVAIEPEQRHEHQGQRGGGGAQSVGRLVHAGGRRFSTPRARREPPN